MVTQKCRKEFNAAVLKAQEAQLLSLEVNYVLK